MQTNEIKFLSCLFLLVCYIIQQQSFCYGIPIRFLCANMVKMFHGYFLTFLPKKFNIIVFSIYVFVPCGNHEFCTRSKKDIFQRAFLYFIPTVIIVNMTANIWGVTVDKIMTRCLLDDFLKRTTEKLPIIFLQKFFQIFNLMHDFCYVGF